MKNSILSIPNKGMQLSYEDTTVASNSQRKYKLYYNVRLDICLSRFTNPK